MDQTNKRYLQQVEKAIASFESLDEWADYISFISKLSRALQLNGIKPQTVSVIPCDQTVANKLSLCLLPNLPNGVHIKVLDLYYTIIQALTIKSFNSSLNIWIPLVLPILSFGSIQVKSEVIKVFRTIFEKIGNNELKAITRPLILSFLAGLDDENSESFPDAFSLLELLQNKLNNDIHFWQNMFLAVIANPEKRLGGLTWFTKRLPVFITIKDGIFTEEATACLTPTPGLLIRSFAVSIKTKTNFNPANDIIIIRGFFDLLLSHVPLNSAIFNDKTSKDKKLLMKSCMEILLKKDMSLNRRVWYWLLGPENNETYATSAELRSNYFQQFGVSTLFEVLLEMINGDIESQINAFKISLSLIIDKWEISHLLIPRVLLPILITCFKADKHSSQYDEILSSAQAFFNGVEAFYIWKDLMSETHNLDLLEFVLSQFDFQDDELKSHIPYVYVIIANQKELSNTRLNVLEMLVELFPKSLAPFNNADKVERIQEVIDFYSNIEIDEKPPLTEAQLSYMIYNSIKVILINQITNPQLSGRICELFQKIVYLLPDSEETDPDILKFLLIQKESTKESSDDEKLNNVIIAFSLSKLLLMLPKISVIDKCKAIKIISTNLWPSLVSLNPNFYQVEAVKCLFGLDLGSHYIEAAISRLILDSDFTDRLNALKTIWMNSSNEADSILMRPLQIVLDDLKSDNIAQLEICNFVKTVSNGGSANRLLKMITNPLLNFDFLALEVTKMNTNDELHMFTYHLKTIINVINTDRKRLKDAFNNEFAVMDNSQKLKIIKANEWDISTYKSLMFYVLEKFLSLRLEDDIFKNAAMLENYYQCTTNSLKLFNILLSGNEVDFDEKFHNLIDYCSYLTILPLCPHEIELIQIHYVKTIFQMLEIAEDSRVNLNLYVDNQEPILIRFIVTGISKAKSPVLLETWIKLLTRSLYMFNEYIFNVLPGINSCLVARLEGYFETSSRNSVKWSYNDVESCINALISGVEDLLSISHSYLSTSKIRADSNIDAGFLGNVIQGVFSIESPAHRTSEHNKLYAILQAFQDSIKIGFKIWQWGDVKPSFQSNDSLINLANKLKFRSKKLLESLIDLERQEIIEMLIDIDVTPFKILIKLLNVLDGGRSQITLPHIINSILTRCYPSLLDESKKSHLQVDINENTLAKFLIHYLESIDNDTVIDIWNCLMQFFKDVLNHFNHFKLLVPNFLKMIETVSLKLTNKYAKKNKKEIADIFIKLLTSSVGKRMFDTNNDKGDDKAVNKVTHYNVDKIENEKDSSDEEESPSDFQDELIDSISDILSNLAEIVQDRDKINICMNIIVLNLITPQIKPLKVHEIPLRTLGLLAKVGHTNSNKAWNLLINDLFQDSSFLDGLNSIKLDIWFQILSSWCTNNERFLESLNKLISTPGTIFSWNEKSEVESRINSIKRVSLMILSQSQDYFLSCLDDIFKKIEINLNNASCPIVFKTQIFILIRILLIKFNPMHLLPYWTVISQHLLTVFESVLKKTSEELSSINAPELILILNACKLLDQLLLLRNDEFNLNEWLFVDNKINMDDLHEVVVSIIDRVSRDSNLTLLKELSLSLYPIDNKTLVPLLNGVQTITSIAALRTFFDSLGYLNYERIYSLKQVDLKTCQEDVISDLIYD